MMVLRSAFAGLFICVLATAALAQSAITKEWKDTLAELGCDGNYALTSPTHDTVWLLASAFSGVSLLKMGNQAGFDNLTEFITTGRSVDRLRDKHRVLEQLLTGTPAATRNLRREVATHGRRLCPVLSFVTSTGFHETGQLQINERDYWQPHSELAQSILVLRGCAILQMDGYFGPASRKAWAATGLKLTAGTLPTPGDILQLAGSTLACGFNHSLTETVAMLGNCRRSIGDTRQSGRLGDEFQAMVADTFDQSLRRVQSVFDLCGSENVWSLGLTPDAIVPLVEVLKFPETDLAGLNKVADEMVDLIKVDGTWQQAESGILFGGAGKQLWQRHGVSTLGRFGLALLAKSKLPSGSAVIDSVSASALDANEKAHFISALVKSTLERQNAKITSVPWDENGAHQLRSAGPLKLDVFLPLEDVHDFLQFAAEMEESAPMRQMALSGGYPQLNYAFATLVLEGFTPGGRDNVLARRHLRAAAEDGHAPSQLRLAMMLKYGQGGTADKAAALSLLQQAAEGGEPAAQLMIAEHFERQSTDTLAWVQAEHYYREAIANLPPTDGADAMRARLIAGGPFWQPDGPGARMLESFALNAVARDDDNDEMTDKRRNWRMFAARMGDHFADSQSGMLLDLTQAAQWWRLAGKDSSWQYGPVQEKLLALLLVQPDLAASPAEIVDLLDGSLHGVWHKNRDVDAFMRQAEIDCPYREADTDTCIVFFHRAALGGVATELSASAFKWLQSRAALELDEIEKDRLRNYVGNEGTTYVWRNPLASIALSDVLIFYGDYAQAAKVIGPLGLVDILHAEVDGMRTVSAGNLRRQIVRHRENPDIDATQKDALERLLSVLIAGGDTVARDFLEFLRTPVESRSNDVDIQVVQSRLARVETHPASRALSNTARQLADLSFANQDSKAAIDYELMALNADMTRHVAAALSGGLLVADMARVCTLSRSSERLFSFGALEIALSLAKDAVNKLQGIRSKLSGLPEELQLCFRKQVAGHYRWLADLFIAQNRPAEASRVLEMLKDFETFQFAERAPGQVGISFEILPLAAPETRLLNAITTSRPAIASQSRRQRRLNQIAAARDLTPQEQAELQALDVELANAAALREETRAFLQQAANKVGRADVSARLAPAKSIKRYLRQRRQDNAAVLQYLVLPNRLGLVLTTADSQSVWSWNTLDGAEFTATDLNAEIALFRSALQSPHSDVIPLARALHDFLLPKAVLQELDASKVTTLIIAPDGQLRYVPFAALHDGSGWLAERYVVTHATAGGVVADTAPAERIAAFGLSHSVEGFAALPGVATEVAALVRENANDAGVLPGSGQMNEDFNATAFARGLVFSDAQTERLGVVHLASHFKLGQTEADSFLLLGDGNRLSVTDIRTGLGRDSDFSEVALLTLSACETAFGSTSADGRELESFAAVAQRQGAQAVLASLWPVADASTAAIMVNLYRRYASSIPLSHALSQSQNDFISGEVNASQPEAVRGMEPLIPIQNRTPSQGWRHPYYWAAFILLEGAV